MYGAIPNMAYMGFNNPMQNFQQQFWNSYLQYCQANGLNPQNQNLYAQYCQMMMMNNPMGMSGTQFNPAINNNPIGMSGTQFNPAINNNPMGQNINQINPNINQINPNINQINPINNPVNVGGTASNNITNNPTPPPNQPVYINDDNKPKEIIPREEKTLYVNPNELKGNNIPAQMSNQTYGQFQTLAGMGSDIINVTLNATTGFKVVIPAPKTMTFEDLFINFANKAGVPVTTIGKEIVFLYNAEKLDPKSKQPISTMFKSFNANITVLDQGGIIGA